MTGAPHSSVKRYRELARNPTKNGLERELLLDGAHLLFEARASGLRVASAAFEHDALNDPDIRALAEQLAVEGSDVLIVSRKVLESMSPVKTPSGVIGIAHKPVQTLQTVLGHVRDDYKMPRRSEATADGAHPLIVVAVDVQDPGNVGGMLRTAEAAGATAFIASASTADPFGWKALRGSMGSALRVPIARAEMADTLRELQAARLRKMALVPRGGRPLFSADFRQPVAIVVGGEGSGLAEDVSRSMDQLISIPMQAPVESLNVGVAAALVLYEAFRQRKGTA